MQGTLLAIFLASLSLAYGFGVRPSRCETFGLSKYSKISPVGEELVGISQHFLFSHAQGFSFVGQIDLFDGNNSIVEMGFAPEFYKQYKDFPTSNSHGRLNRDNFISSRLEDVVGSASFVYNTNVDISEGVNYNSAYIIAENPVNHRPDLAWFEGENWQAEYHGHLRNYQGKYIAVECEKGWEYCDATDFIEIGGEETLGSFGSGNPLLLTTPEKHTCSYELTFNDGFQYTALTFQTALADGDYVSVYVGDNEIARFDGEDRQGVQDIVITESKDISVFYHSESDKGHGFHAIYERIDGTDGSCFTALDNAICNDNCLVSFVTGGFVEGFIDTEFDWTSCTTKWAEECALAAEFAIDIQFCTVPRQHSRSETSQSVQRTYDFYVSQ